jgi:hypothetical protein
MGGVGSYKKKRFFSFKFKATLHRLRHIGRISEALCDFDEI